LSNNKCIISISMLNLLQIIMYNVLNDKININENIVKIENNLEKLSIEKSINYDKLIPTGLFDTVV
jgi:hypothetical protein